MKKNIILTRRETLRLFIPVFLVGLLMSLSMGVAFASEPPSKIPHAFYGDILIDGSPAPVDTKVEAKGTGVVTTIYNPIHTNVVGQYGTPGGTGDKLLVQGDTIEEGTILTFCVNDYDTGQTFVFEEGGLDELDLELITININCELTTANTTGGSVALPLENPYPATCGTVVDILAVPDDCYEFAGWTGDTPEAFDAINAPALAGTFIKLSDNYTITANFAPKQFELNVGSTGGGSVIDPGEGLKGPYDCGEEVDLLAEPDGGYVFAEWTIDPPEALYAINAPNAADTYITMNGDYSITAHFVSEDTEFCELTTFSTEGGSVMLPAVSPYSVPCGTVVNIEATADECYKFLEWTGDLDTVDNVTAAHAYITMSDNYTITANFELAGIEIPFNAGWNTFSTPVILNDCMDTWDEFIAINGLQVSMVYGYDSAAESWVSPDGNDEIQCGYGYYVKTSVEAVAHAAPDTGAIPSVIPLSRGVHLIGTPQCVLEDIDVASALETIYEATNEYIGYTLVVSPYINSPNDWDYVRDAGDPPTMNVGRAYWVVMENAGFY